MNEIIIKPEPDPFYKRLVTYFKSHPKLLVALLVTLIPAVFSFATMWVNSLSEAKVLRIQVADLNHRLAQKEAESADSAPLSRR
jgi:hypothetical protein